MRDPERIARIILKLERLWQLVPDQRFGQLLENYIYPATLIKHASVAVIEWHLEDDKLEKRIDHAYERVSKELDNAGVGKTAR
jgi:hypothetical protein